MGYTLSAELGQRLRTYRQLLKLTQEELAEKSGLHQTYIGQVERGEKNLTITSLDKIVHSLKISYTELFNEIDEFYDTPDNTALKCYRIIRDKEPDDQLHLYNIILEIDRMK